MRSTQIVVTNLIVDGNCQIISNLKFCDEVAYAVPSHPDNTSDIASWYDGNAEQYYRNFSNSLQQVACNTTSSAQYSLVRGCQDCEVAYKRWLCAVTIPRCEDYSSSNNALFERNIGQSFANGTALAFNYQYRLSGPGSKYTNGSRNLAIDSEIQPGPYKELLPCEDLCFSLVQSCPAVLQFSCPSQREAPWSYGRWENSENFTCNPLDPSLLLNAGGTISSPAMMRTALLYLVGFWLWYSF
jgi:Stretch-activated Ca2+-permeable channel component